MGNNNPRNAISSINTIIFYKKSLLQLLLFLTVLNFSVVSFNVEERYPILKTGPTGSLFGLSVAQHLISDKIDAKNDAILLVGAPTDDPASGEVGPGPGALYKCSVLTDGNCTNVPITPQVIPNAEDISRQWLGVTVQSYRPGGRIVVGMRCCKFEANLYDAFSQTCAHRYTLLGRDWEAPLGRCFLLNADVTPVDDPNEFQYVPCENKQDTTNRYSHENFGYCQAGVSAHFAADVSGQPNMQPYLVVGTPGSVHWGGTSASSGSIYKSNVINFVTGAPGANATGNVYILEAKYVGGTPGDENDYMSVVEVLEGDTVASRFGHDVLVVDVNGDGKMDLVVSAPQYYDRKEQLGGAVYVYVNKGLPQLGPTASQTLYGKIDSYFGMTVASAGDINMDGVHDIVIGAPGDNDWTGAVYIYHGDNSPESVGLRPKPTQVIEASMLSPLGSNFRGFGYSISGGLDLDMNGYPDLAVGSLSDSAVIFFSRPVVDISGTIAGPAKRIELTESPSEQVLNVTACLKYTAVYFDERVTVVGYVVLDTERVEQGLLSRLSFVGSPSKETVANKSFTMTLYPQSTGRVRCRTWKTYMKNDVQDKLSPIELKLSFKTPDAVKKRKRRDTSYKTPIPVMNAAIVSTASAQLEFAKQCGSDEICNSNLVKSAYYQVLKNGNWTDLKERDGEPLLVLGTEEQIGMVIEITNYKGEDAHQAMMEILLPAEVAYRRVDVIAGNAIHCDPDRKNESLVVCHLGNPFKEEGRVKFLLKMTKTNKINKATEFAVRLQLLTTSQQMVPDPGTDYRIFVEVEAQLMLDGYPSREQVKFSGEVVGSSVVKRPSDAGLLHTHTYEVSNAGTGVVEDVALKIRWPQEIGNGKWLFYLMEADAPSPGNCTLPEGVNPLRLKSDGSRQKRDADPAPGDLKSISDSGTSEYAILDCGSGGDDVSCMEITCFLGDLAPKSTQAVAFTAILWNSTFLEEYSRVTGVYVTSFAELTVLQQNIKFSDHSKLDSVVSTTVLPEILFVPEVPLQWWIIVVASVAGLILLVFLVLIMWKCGFFKRQKHVDYQKARKHKQASKKAEEKETLY